MEFGCSDEALFSLHLPLLAAEAVCEYLRRNYREYTRTKLPVFRQQVERAVEAIARKGGVTKAELRLQVGAVAGYDALRACRGSWTDGGSRMGRFWLCRSLLPPALLLATNLCVALACRQLSASTPVPAAARRAALPVAAPTTQTPAAAAAATARAAANLNWIVGRR